MANAICFTILIYRSQANSNDPAKVKASMSSARWATSLDGSGAVLLRRQRPTADLRSYVIMPDGFERPANRNRVELFGEGE